MVDNGVQLDSNQQQQYVNLIRNYAINVLEPKDKEIFIVKWIRHSGDMAM